MVTSTDFYLLKLQYKGEEVETGDVKKLRKEFLAECTSYSDAETLVNEIIDDEKMNKYEPAVYEIQKLKISDIKFSEHLIVNDDSLNDLTELYFESDDAHFYRVKVEEPDLDSEKPKTIKHEMFIPAESTGEAEHIAKMFYKDGVVANTTKMAFETAFVLKSTCDHIKEKFSNM